MSQSATTPSGTSAPLFRYITSAKKRPSEYEEVTLHMQWSPLTFATQGFFCRGSGGREVWDQRSTRVTCSDWWKFRDPYQLWFQPYVEQQARSEDTIEQTFDGAMLSGAIERISERWRGILGRYYAAYRFFEYGLFLATSYAQREALSDVVGTPTVFEGMDRDRHAQAIALYCMDLEGALPGFSDKESRDAWMNDPALVPAREYVERLMACRDWVEILVATDLVLEPLVAVPWSRGFIARFAPLNGDTVSPVILDTVELDRKRHIDVVTQLSTLLIADQPGNKAIFQEWIDLWEPRARAAQGALRSMFATIDESAWVEESTKANAAYGAILSSLGLELARAAAAPAEAAVVAPETPPAPEAPVLRDSKRVSMHLMVGEEALAAAEILREKYSDARIDKFPAYLSVEREGSLSLSVTEIGERLGRAYDISTFLVVMSSYIGRIRVDDDTVTLRSEIGF